VAGAQARTRRTGPLGWAPTPFDIDRINRVLADLGTIALGCCASTVAVC
jgi:hypothetical protein